jgi:hypothetical protein
MGSYYKKQKKAGTPRYVTHAPWLYHTTLPDLLPAIREQGLRPLRDVASRLARDAAEKAAADAGVEPDQGFVHLHAAEEPLRLALLRREVALLRVRTSGLDVAFLTRDPRAALAVLGADDAALGPGRRDAIARLRLPGDIVFGIQEGLAARDAAGALDRLGPFMDAMPERAWEAPPFDGSYRYAGIIPGAALQVLLELPAEIAAAVSVSQALATPLALDSRRWGPLTAADLAAAARGLGRTEFPADPAF